MKRKGGGPSFFYTFLFHFLIALFWFLGSNLLLSFYLKRPVSFLLNEAFKEGACLSLFLKKTICFLDFLIKLYMF
jgi:hypothetical protein